MIRYTRIQVTSCSKVRVVVLDIYKDKFLFFLNIKQCEFNGYCIPIAPNAPKDDLLLEKKIFRITVHLYYI